MNDFLKYAIDLWIIDFLEKNGPKPGHEIWTAMLAAETGTTTETGTAMGRLEKEGIIEGSGPNYWWDRIFSLKNNKFFQQSEDEMVISDLLQTNGKDKKIADIAAKMISILEKK